MSEEPEDYRNLPGITTDSCLVDCDDGGDDGYDDGGDGGDGGGEGDVCNYRTQTQGGWGTACNGGNPGCFRDAHFDDVFPSGLVVGCGATTATLKSSSAVEKALPTGGKPREMYPHEAEHYYGNGDDPKPKTVLFGQIVALTLSVHFDALEEYNPLDPAVPLAALEIADMSSPCFGETVAWVLEQANLALGGCASELTPSEANACTTLINESFVDGGESCSADLMYDDRNDRCAGDCP